jgi:RNA polymerase sigma factor (TIGR02999 family)
MPEPPEAHEEEAGLVSEERRSLDDLFSLIYEELRSIASSVRRNEMHSTLNSTALVDEAWLRLKDSPQLASTSRPHFKGIAARVMRQVLVDAARHRNAWGGKEAIRVPVDESIEGATSFAAELLAVHEALDSLAKIDPTGARVVELKYFAGLTDAEIAEELGVSKSKVERSWRAAKARLKTQLCPAR